MPQSIDDLLNSIDSNNAQTTKQASATGTMADRVEAARQDLAGALAQHQEQQTKLAQYGHTDSDAVAVLKKTAQEAAAAEQQAQIKEAHLYGAAVADGFVGRLQAYGDYAQKVAQYNASVGGQPQPQQQHARAQQPQQYREKSAQEDIADGAMLGLEKVAAATLDCYERGVQQGVALIKHFSQNQ